MAGSKFQKIRDIFSRTSGLLKSGAMKPEDKPRWFDVYEAFPPIEVPKFHQRAPTVDIKEIFYPEDVIRAKFYLKYGSPGTISLNESRTLTRPNFSEAFIEAYQSLESDGLDENERMISAERKLEMAGIYLDRSRRQQKPTAEGLQEDQESKSIISSADFPEEVLQKVSLRDIFDQEEEDEAAAAIQRKAASSRGLYSMLEEENYGSSDFTEEDQKILLATVEKLNKFGDIMDEPDDASRVK